MYKLLSIKQIIEIIHSFISARSIYRAASNTNRHDFRLEDMFFTGILRRKANLQGL